MPFANHCIETLSDFYTYKRDKVNAFGSIDQDQIADNPHANGVDSGSVQWFQKYVKQASIITATQYGTFRGW